jgi:hypothetical protein
MRGIQQYFDLITSVVERSGAASVNIEFEQLDPEFGTVDGVLSFYDGSQLEFTETVAIERYRPAKLSYRYQYVRAGEAMLRYDSAPHHPDLPRAIALKSVAKDEVSKIRVIPASLEPFVVNPEFGAGVLA